MIALVALSPEGLATARVLQSRMGEGQLFAHVCVQDPDAMSFQRMADLAGDLWSKAVGMVFFAPTGAVVRAIAPCIASKYTDPAIVVCDVLGRWSVSLLSGHEGGANDLALKVGNLLGAEPVITTTTEAVKDLMVGVGCRKGTSASAIEQAVREGLARCGEPLDRVRYLASAELKAQEPGLQEAARHLGLPLRFIAHAAIRQADLALTPSAVAERHVDLPGVAEPSALLAGTRTHLRLPRTVIDGITVAIAQEERP